MKQPKEVLVFSKELNAYSFGLDHPLRMERLQLTMDLIEAYGLMDNPNAPWMEAKAAEDRDLLLFHTREYLDVLKRADSGQTTSQARFHGLGSGDNPTFPGLYRWSLLVTGATMECLRQVLCENMRVAFNVSGGLHHAMPGRASGFCYINDPAVCIAHMLKEGLRVAYVDVDAHHGDGVEAAFYNTDQVLTISLHQHGHTLFPGTGYSDDMGQGPGEGFTVNVPLAPGTDDDLYLWAFMEVVPPLVKAYDPDILVTQLGVDSLVSDPLTGLNLTLQGYLKLVKEMKSWDKKWVALGGGGYNIMNVARGWSHAWAIMKGIDIPEELPETFVKSHPGEVGIEDKLSDPSLQHGIVDSNYVRKLAEEAVARIKKNIFPVLGI